AGPLGAVCAQPVPVDPLLPIQARDAEIRSHVALPPCVCALPTCVRKYLTVQGGSAPSWRDFRTDLKSQANTLELVLRETMMGKITRRGLAHGLARGGAA